MLRCRRESATFDMKSTPTPIRQPQRRFPERRQLASGMALDPDGALLPHDGDANSPGRTELAVLTLGGTAEHQ